MVATDRWPPDARPHRLLVRAATIDSATLADPRIVDAKAEPRSCVSGKGFAFTDLDTTVAEIQEQLGALQDHERGVAVALLDCGGSPEDSAARYREVRAEYEQRFLDTEAARLATFMAGHGR